MENKADRSDPSRRRGHHPHAEPRPAPPPLHHPPAVPEPPLAAEVVVKEAAITFASLPIAEPVRRAIDDLGFAECTSIQAKALPDALAGRDVGGKAQTGTGKTAAFLITAFTWMAENPRPNRPPGTPRVLILAPTRELAIQICNDADDLGKYTGLTNLVVFGGTDYRKQMEALGHTVDLVVATPGRLLDYVGQRLLDLSDVEILVIDEADRMLDMGFIPDVRRIVRHLPPTSRRQTLLFSATLTDDIMRLVSAWMHEPVMIDVQPENLVTDLVDQRFYTVGADQRLAVVLWHLHHDHVERMLIFANRRDTAEYLAGQLPRYGIACGLLSGDVPQKKRMRLLEEFRAGKTPVIVATDVAARGIHVDNISHVINWDLPYEPDDYVHRIGRTGRAGEKGKAISLADEFGAYIIPELEAYLGAGSIACSLPTPEMVELPEMTHPDAGGAPHHSRGRSMSDRRGGGGRGGGRGGNRSRRR